MTIEELLSEYEKYNPSSKRLWERAKNNIPGGISANVKYYTPFPLYMKSGQGAYLTDVDDHRYIDYSLSYGPLVLGHGRKEISDALTEYLDLHGTFLYGPPHEGEIQLAELLKEYYPSMERIRFTNSGTEATLLATRISAAYTGKYKIAKFEGHYHGGHNAVLVSVNPNVRKAGNEKRPTPLRGSAGISDEQLSMTIVLPFNDLEACRTILYEHQDDVGCVIIEPFQGGTIPGTKEFILGLRDITREMGMLLVFDEVKTGFRVGMKGAQGIYGVDPDLTTLGKIIGGGFPIGALGGKKEIMDLADPSRIGFFDKDKTIDRSTAILFHSGTYNGHPAIVALGIKTIRILEKELDTVSKNTEVLKNKIRNMYAKHGVRVLTPGTGAMFHICITDQKEIQSYRDMKKCDFGLRRRLDYALMMEGVYNKPCTRYHTSTAHTEEIVDLTLEAYERAFRRV